MTSYLLQSLQIFTELSIETVGNTLAECTVFPVLLSIEEPVWDLVLTWVEHDSFHTFDLIIVELTGSLDKNLSKMIRDQRTFITFERSMSAFLQIKFQCELWTLDVSALLSDILLRDFTYFRVNYLKCCSAWDLS